MSELKFLALSIVLGFIQLLLSTGAKSAARGLDWNLSPRDKSCEPLPEKAARLDRAFENFKETFPFFLAAVFLVSATGTSGSISQMSAFVYLTARAVYIPVYYYGVTVIRTVVWSIGTLGIIGILAQVFI